MDTSDLIEELDKIFQSCAANEDSASAFALTSYIAKAFSLTPEYEEKLRNTVDPEGQNREISREEFSRSMLAYISASLNEPQDFEETCFSHEPVTSTPKVSHHSEFQIRRSRQDVRNKQNSLSLLNETISSPSPENSNVAKNDILKLINESLEKKLIESAALIDELKEAMQNETKMRKECHREIASYQELNQELNAQLQGVEEKCHELTLENLKLNEDNRRLKKCCDEVKKRLCHVEEGQEEEEKKHRNMKALSERLKLELKTLKCEYEQLEENNSAILAENQRLMTALDEERMHNRELREASRSEILALRASEEEYGSDICLLTPPLVQSVENPIRFESSTQTEPTVEENDVLSPSTEIEIKHTETQTDCLADSSPTTCYCLSSTSNRKGYSRPTVEPLVEDSDNNTKMHLSSQMSNIKPQTTIQTEPIVHLSFRDNNKMIKCIREESIKPNSYLGDLYVSGSDCNVMKVCRLIKLIFISSIVLTMLVVMKVAMIAVDSPCSIGTTFKNFLMYDIVHIRYPDRRPI